MSAEEEMLRMEESTCHSVQNTFRVHARTERHRYAQSKRGDTSGPTGPARLVSEMFSYQNRAKGYHVNDHECETSTFFASLS